MADSAPIRAQSPLLLMLVVLLVSLATLAPFIGHCAIYLAYPFSLDETEGYVLGQVHRLSIGGQLYGPIDASPYVVDNYPPALPVLFNGLEQTLGRAYVQPTMLPVPGVAEDDERAVGVKAATFAHNLPLLRSVILLMVLGILALLAWDWKSQGVAALAIGLGLLLFIGQPAVFFMCPLTRADWPALLCGIAALVCAQRALALPEDRRWLIGSAIIGAAALLFRQSAIVPLIAIGGTLLLARDRRFALFAGVAISTALLIGLGLQLTYGDAIWVQLVQYTKTRWLFERLIGTWGFFVRHSSLLLVLAAMAWTSVKKSSGWSLPVLYAPLALATGLLSGKVGSDMNYFLEPLLGSVWLIGYALRQWSDAAQRLRVWALVGITMVLLQSAVFQNPREGSYRPTRFDRANGTELLLQLQQLEGSILSEEEGIVALAGKEVIYNPFIMAELEREGLWDDAPLVAGLKARTYPVVIVRELPNPGGAIDRGQGAGWDRWSPAMQQALAEHYRPAVVVPFRREWIVMVPKR